MAILKPAVILAPYCAGGTAGTDYIVPPQTGASTVQSQNLGWPAIFQEQLPPDGSGEEITRQQFNGVHNLYSSHDFWLQAGGTYSFESTISSQYSGYPAGTLLWNSANSAFSLGLVNSNTANFVSTNSYANDGINWQQITSFSPYIQTVDIAGTTYNAKATDTLKRFVCNSVGSGVLNFNANSVSFPAGYTSYIGGAGTQLITLNLTNGANTLLQIKVPSSPTLAQITYDGVNWYINGIIQGLFTTFNLNHGSFITASSTTFTVPSWVNYIIVTAVGGGGGGGGGLNSDQTNGSGGGSGASIYREQFTVTPGNSITITIGAGGAGGSNGSSPTNGGTGGTTSIGSPVSVSLSGGGGGLAGVSNGGNPIAGGVSGGNGGQPGQCGLYDNFVGSGGAGSIFGEGQTGLLYNQTPSTLNYNAGSGGAGGVSTVPSGIHGGGGAVGQVVIEW